MSLTGFRCLKPGCLSADVWHEQNPQMKLDGDKTSVLVERLKPATAYQFRLYAENQLGRSAPSDILHVSYSKETYRASSKFSMEILCKVFDWNTLRNTRFPTPEY